MADFFSYKYSTSHMFFPKIVIAILLVIGIFIIVPGLIKKIKNHEAILPRGKKFFVEGYDKLKLFGTLILFILYVIALDLVGFLPASIIFVFLFNVLFCGTKEKKSLITSAIISVVSSLTVWFLFGVVFNITLP